jgi:hypothetical protein
MTVSSRQPERGPSRIAAARERAATAKAALLVSALLAFFGAIILERGTASANADHSAPASAPSSIDGSDGFDSGGLAPSQGAPSTSTGTS